MRERRAELIGSPRSLHTMFYFPFSDRDNIRFDPAHESMGAIPNRYRLASIFRRNKPEVGLSHFLKNSFPG